MQNQFPGPDIFRRELGPLDYIGNVEPFDIVNSPATPADEMMVVFGVALIVSGVAHQRYFPHQASLHQGMQAVIDRRPRGPRVARIDGTENLIGGEMRRVPPKIVEENVALRSAPQAARAESTDDGFAMGSHRALRILLILDCVKPRARRAMRR